MKKLLEYIKIAIVSLAIKVLVTLIKDPRSILTLMLKILLPSKYIQFAVFDSEKSSKEFAAYARKFKTATTKVAKNKKGL